MAVCAAATAQIAATVRLWLETSDCRSIETEYQMACSRCGNALTVVFTEPVLHSASSPLSKAVNGGQLISAPRR